MYSAKKRLLGGGSSSGGSTSVDGLVWGRAGSLKVYGTYGIDHDGLFWALANSMSGGECDYAEGGTVDQFFTVVELSGSGGYITSLISPGYVSGIRITIDGVVTELQLSSNERVASGGFLMADDGTAMKLVSGLVALSIGAPCVRFESSMKVEYKTSFYNSNAPYTGKSGVIYMLDVLS